MLVCMTLCTHIWVQGCLLVHVLQKRAATQYPLLWEIMWLCNKVQNILLYTRSWLAILVSTFLPLFILIMAHNMPHYAACTTLVEASDVSEITQWQKAEGWTLFSKGMQHTAKAVRHTRLQSPTIELKTKHEACLHIKMAIFLHKQWVLFYGPTVQCLSNLPIA